MRVCEEYRQDTVKYGISRTLLDIVMTHLDKRGSAYFDISRTLLDISRICLELNMVLLDISRAQLHSNRTLLDISDSVDISRTLFRRKHAELRCIAVGLYIY